jgi:aspartyl/asparaginyl beta-hydroxylase (cupin superfamily)
VNRLLFTRLVVRPAKLAMEWLIARSAGAPRPTFFDAADFQWTRTLELAFPLVRRELDAVLRESTVPDFRDLSPPQAAIVAGGGWKSFFLCLTGQKVTENCLRCPETARLLETIPGLENAFFSVLEGGTHLTPHHGPYGGLLRYHLGLRMPSDPTQCLIRVAEDFRHWQEGKSLVFDDSHEHEAWNRAAEARVVLFVDFERPLPRPLSWLNRWLLALIARAAFVEELRRNLAAASP